MGLDLRIFTLVLAGLGVVYNGLSAFFIYRLQAEMVTIPLNIHIYTSLAALISLSGVYGALRRHTYTLHLFSHFLILDTIISAIPRLALLYLFSSFRDLLCDLDPSASPLPFAMAHGTFTNVNPDRTPLDLDIAGQENKACINVFSLGVGIAAIGLVLATTIQMFAAIMVLKYAKEVAEQREGTVRKVRWSDEESVVVVPRYIGIEEEEWDDEKARLFKFDAVLNGKSVL